MYLCIRFLCYESILYNSLSLSLSLSQEEMVTPHSLCFNSDGTKLYTGFQNCIRIYDTGRPGRQYETKTTYGK